MLIGNEPLYIGYHLTPLVTYHEKRHEGGMPDVGSLWYLGRVHSRPSCKLVCTFRRIVFVHAARATIYNTRKAHAWVPIVSVHEAKAHAAHRLRRWDQCGNQLEPSQEPSILPVINIVFVH